MKTTVKKTFLDIHKEEEWLNEQGQNGLMLTHYHGGEYEFENVSPAKYQYKIDLPAYTGSKKKEYLAFLEQTGITVVTEYGGRVYLRKNAADGPLDVYTEKKEIAKQMSKRYSHFFAIGIPQLMVGLIMLIQTLYYVKPEGVPFYITMGIDAGLMISGIIFFIMGIQKCRKYDIPREDKDIWE
ncbi:MAG: DUF2812 domain-containing protein [Lachnospiraceae bacterium]|uniref:DUF2812 domain-containing protein n=1 Tax=Porcincola intestinalis TaxID=2606632 RepID=A0A6L5X2F1_9FIRM|nr:DUF2812 domain-containing protein [Porcincola intestinalis]MCI6767123.1 DUF2812 domain-containing protein [Lachnospiraceae bacterium]MSS13805.1 DUF2812 domain-containing protein [Porcincola intestinalis]